MTGDMALRNHVGSGTAGAIRELIERTVGPCYWDGFEDYATEPSKHGKEWRFGGALGFGGKLHVSAGRVWVSAYPEDLRRDPAIEPALDDLNARLATLAFAPGWFHDRGTG